MDLRGTTCGSTNMYIPQVISTNVNDEAPLPQSLRWDVYSFQLVIMYLPVVT